MARSRRGALVTLGILIAATMVVAPLAGWPSLLRLPAILVPVLLAALFVLHPWTFDGDESSALDAWNPSRRFLWLAAVGIGLMLFWIVLTRFRSGQINAIDFTVYFDRPLFQTLHGHPLLVETADDPGRAARSLLVIHAYWWMFPLAGLYAIHATPLWLLALSVLAVVAGAVHVVRIVQRLGGGGLLACSAALAFVLNDNTARTLNYGFHIEVLYAWFVPWLLDAGLHRRKVSYGLAALACIGVKEDAFMLLLAAAVALALHRWREMPWSERVYFLAIPTFVALVNLGVYTRVVVPHLTGGAALIYGSYWLQYGPTPMSAVVGMLRQPWQVIERTLTSDFFTRVLVPHLFLPLVGWRWFVGVLPIVVLYGAATNEQMRSFGIYYSIVLVPFLVIGSAAGATAIVRNLRIPLGRGRILASAILVAGAVITGSTNAGYSLRPWRPEVSAMPVVVKQLANEPVVLVQSGLYPHAGYDTRVQLLTPAAVGDARNAGAVIVLAPAIGAYPFSPSEFDALLHHPEVVSSTDGVSVRRLPTAPR